MRWFTIGFRGGDPSLMNRAFEVDELQEPEKLIPTLLRRASEMGPRAAKRPRRRRGA